MKMRYNSIIACTFLILLFCFSASAQTEAFHKGALLVSASEGTTWADYSTENTWNDHKTNSYCLGQRDPISLEYGLSKHWGIGLTSGADQFNVDPNLFYGFGTAGAAVKATTSELTIDGHYHFFVTKKADISAYVSVGGFSVTMKGNEGDGSYNYVSCGNIIRLGSCARYYFFKRLGVLASLSSYAARSATAGHTGNTVANNYNTNISGLALEFGFCFRFF